MAIIWFIFIIFPCHCAVYMYKITILQKPLSQFPPNFTLILLLKFRNHLAEFHQISHWSFCWNVFDSLFKWSCSIDCQAHIFFFKTKNCSNDDIFISCDDRTGKMLHNICMSAVAMSLRWANCGPWASCFFLFPRLKKMLSTNKYMSRSSLGSAIYQCLQQIPKADCLSAFCDWVKRLQKCVSVKEEYFEGL